MITCSLKNYEFINWNKELYIEKFKMMVDLNWTNSYKSISYSIDSFCVITLSQEVAYIGYTASSEL